MIDGYIDTKSLLQIPMHFQTNTLSRRYHYLRRRQSNLPNHPLGFDGETTAPNQHPPNPSPTLYPCISAFLKVISSRQPTSSNPVDTQSQHPHRTQTCQKHNSSWTNRPTNSIPPNPTFRLIILHIHHHEGHPCDFDGLKRIHRQNYYGRYRERRPHLCLRKNQYIMSLIPHRKDRYQMIPTMKFPSTRRRGR